MNKRRIQRSICIIKEITDKIYDITEDTVIFKRNYKDDRILPDEKAIYQNINSSGSLYQDKMKLYWDFTQEKKLKKLNDWNIIHDQITKNFESNLTFNINNIENI